jgi:feruloyl esterase
VEKGAAPEKIIATKYSGEGASRHQTMTRPLCPYPQLPHYKGSGDPNDESSFTCAAPAK